MNLDSLLLDRGETVSWVGGSCISFEKRVSAFFFFKSVKWSYAFSHDTIQLT